MSVKDNHNELLNLIAGQGWHLDRLYSQLAKDLAPILRKYKNFGGRAVWKGNEKIRAEIRQVLKAHNIRLTAHIENKILQGWNLAHSHSDNLVKSYTKGMEVPKPLSSVMLYRNTAVIDAYLKHGRDKKLSKRVWNITKETEGHIKRFLQEGLAEGRSAVDLTKDLRQYLKEPDKRFRRIRDKNGKLILSNAAKNYNPGRGVYRSSYKNALRLARNEINIGYRMADVERRKRMPFVMGVTVCLSPAHPTYDICDELVGDYPSNYIFTGFHPNCLCYTKSKLLPKSEFKKYLQTGKIPEKYRIKSVDTKRLQYVSKNKDKLKGLYFFRDNKQLWNENTDVFRTLKEMEYQELLSKQKISTNAEKLLYNSFNGYVKTANSFTINAYHRGMLKRVTPAMENSINDTTKILDGVIKSNSLKSNTEVFRMVDNSYAYNVLGIDVSNLEKLDLKSIRKNTIGKNITDKGFTSTSCLENANAFQNRKIMLKMKAKKGTNCFIPKNPEESEIIFGRNQINIIKDVKIKDNKVIIYTEMFE